MEQYVIKGGNPLVGEVEIGGVMPLSALERLARAGIRAYCVRKVSVCRLKLYVRAKEMQKVFAFGYKIIS